MRTLLGYPIVYVGDDPNERDFLETVCIDRCNNGEIVVSATREGGDALLKAIGFPFDQLDEATRDRIVASWLRGYARREPTFHGPLSRSKLNEILGKYYSDAI